MMKKNEHVFLFCGEWCRVLYRKGFNDFKFVHCRDPTLDAERVCLIATNHLTYRMSEVIRDLFEPLRFARDLSRRVLESDESPRVAELLTFSKGDYRETCLKLEQLMNDVMHQRNLWKDHFFFYAINADKNDLCGTCKEEMRQAFYVKGDEEEALKWRLGNRDGKGECVWRNCKHFSWESFEEEYDDEYVKHCKNMEMTDTSEDEMFTQ